MRAEFVLAIVRGDRLVWVPLAMLWALALVTALRQSRRGASHARVFGVLALATATSLVSTAVAAAVGIPRIRWSDSSDPALLAKSDESWRKLRGPAVAVLVGGVPEIAVPTVDERGDWVLWGLLSGRRIEGLPAAATGTPELGGLRLCGMEDEHCRPWPASWPDPTRSPVYAELVWSKDGGDGALAYDAESNLYLREITGADAQGRALEVIGRLTNDPPREGTAVLFVARRVVGGRLQAARMIATAGGSPPYRIERADVSLEAAPRARRWIAGPLLWLGGLALPLGLLAYLLAPMLFGAGLRKRAAVRELARALVLVPIAEAPGAPPERGREAEGPRLASVADDADLGDALLVRGTIVSATLGAPAGRPVASRRWFELPPSREVLAEADLASQDPPRRMGTLVPADAAPFRRWAWASMRPYADTGAMVALGLAMTAPGVVAVTALFAGR